jgi:hypothetical protein
MKKGVWISTKFEQIMNKIFFHIQFATYLNIRIMNFI